MIEEYQSPFVRFHKALSEYGQACRDFQRMTVHLNALEIETAREKMRLAEVKVLTLFNTFTLWKLKPPERKCGWQKWN